MKVITCPLCRAGAYEPVCSKLVGGFWYGCVQCRACGFYYVNPEPDASELAALYEAEPSDCHSAIWHGFEDDLNGAVIRSLAGFGVESLVDLGAGQGRFVRMARDAGMKAGGVEPSGENCRIAMEKYGVQLTNLTVREYLATTRDRLGCVTMLNVLEHLPDPLGTLRRLAELLSPRGTLLVVVPNVTFTLFLGGARRALWFRDPYMLQSARFSQQAFCPPMHLSSFSGTTLRRALETAGFRLSRLEQAPVIGSSDPLMRLAKTAIRAAGFALQVLTRNRLVFGYSLLAVATSEGDCAPPSSSIATES